MDCGEHASPGWGSRLWHHHIVTKIASDRSPKTKKYFPSPLLCVLLSMWKWQRGSCSLYLSSKYLHTEKTVKSTPWGHQNLCVRQPLLWHKQLINKNCTASSSASCVAYLRARVCVCLCVFFTSSRLFWTGPAVSRTPAGLFPAPPRPRAPHRKLVED